MVGNHLKPISIGVSALFFGAISLFIAIGIYVVVPFAKNSGYLVFPIYYGTLFLASLLGIILSVVLYNRDKKKGWLLNQTFLERFWIKQLIPRDIIWGLALLVFWIITLMLIKAWYSQLVSPPAHLLSNIGSLYGINLKGAFWVIPILGIFLVVNIVGEELFWRGYLLPRQEVKYGQKAWIINGLLWSAFHAPLYWIAPAIAPGCIALAFVTQKRKSLWPAIIAHFLLNATDMITGIFSQI